MNSIPFSKKARGMVSWRLEETSTTTRGRWAVQWNVSNLCRFQQRSGKTRILLTAISRHWFLTSHNYGDGRLECYQVSMNLISRARGGVQGARDPPFEEKVQKISTPLHYNMPIICYFLKKVHIFVLRPTPLKKVQNFSTTHPPRPLHTQTKLVTARPPGVFSR